MGLQSALAGCIRKLLILRFESTKHWEWSFTCVNFLAEFLSFFCFQNVGNEKSDILVLLRMTNNA